MPQIIIVNLNNKVIPFRDIDKVLSIIQDNFIDWMHACGGKGRCTTCKMIVQDGMNNLTPRSPFEEKCFNNGHLQDNERLACQCRVSGDIIIKVPEENKFPHMTYSE